MFKTLLRKKIIPILLIVGVIAVWQHKAIAQAVNLLGNRIEATFGGQDSAKNYRLTCDVTGFCQWAPDTALGYPYENIASGTTIGGTSGYPGTGYTLTSLDSGLNISDYGGLTAGVAAPGTKTGSGTRYILPTCSSSNLGLQFDISTAVKETITITPSSTADSIAWSLSGTGLSAGIGIKNSGSGQAGDEVQVTCTSVGNYTIKNLYGTWAVAT